MKTLKIILVVLGLVAGAIMGIRGGFDIVEPALGIATLFAAGSAWFEQRRDRRLGNQPIIVNLVIEGEGQKVELPLEILRRDLSRAELLGRIGMIPMQKPGSRFSLRQLGTPATMRELNRVVSGETSELVIPASQEEVDQFDL